ncbi:MAG: hypothetical protein FJ358_06350 [Thaumarchaeota archaeon]|nr:hypothetical protein [Nitrososphaerota archaeon]
MISEPSRFVDSLELGRHVLLCYEEPEWARHLEFRIIENGLLEGEHCVYVSIEDSPEFIESQMEDYGIDVKGFKKKKMLHIHKVASPIDAKSDLPTIGDVLSKVPKPYRLVGRTYKLDSQKKVKANLDIEKQGSFAAAKSIMFVCSYDMGDIDLDLLRLWLPSVMKKHHDVIFAPRTGFGIGIPMR